MVWVCLSDPPLLQTNGKMPLWFRRLVSGQALVLVSTSGLSVCVCVFSRVRATLQLWSNQRLNPDRCEAAGRSKRTL